MMRGTVAWEDQAVGFECEPTESDFWRAASEIVFENIPCPQVGETPVVFRIDAEERGTVTLAMTARGTYDDGSGEKPSPFVVHEAPAMPYSSWSRSRSAEAYADPSEAHKALCQVGGSIRFEDAGEYRDAYLAYASPITEGGKGSYKKYELFTEGETMRARYGRIGSSGGFYGERVTKPVPRWIFHLRRREKLAKSYIDLTSAYLTGDEQDMLFAGLTALQVKNLADAGVKNLVELCGMTPERLCGVKGIGPKRAAAIQRKLEAHGMSLDVPEGGGAGDGDNADAAALYALLSDYASNTVNTVFEAGSGGVTSAMVRASREIIAEMQTATSVEQFNRLLLSLMLVCPRRAANVSEFLAKGTSDFDRILRREDGLVMAMEAVVSGRLPQRRRRASGSFSAHGIDVRVATPDEFDEVWGKLRDPQTGEMPYRLRDRSQMRVWRVEPRQQSQLFEEYVERRGVSETSLLWHGSASSCWLSIVTTNLQIRPSAAHGRAFGNGLYFAPRCEKSLGYTDGGRWSSGGGGKRVYLGLYEVATGNPYDPSRGHRWDIDQKFLDSVGCDCTWARGGDRFLFDEVIVYDEAACRIKYLVEMPPA